MGKSTDCNVAAESEFALLAQVLDQTADEAASCLGVLKKNLSEYDSRHGDLFPNTAKSYLRSDVRNAKDVAMGLKDVANQINKSHKLSNAEVISARRMMKATEAAMDVLKVAAHNYDKKNGQTTGIKGGVGNATDKTDNDEDVGSLNILDSPPDTVEALVKSTLRNNFNLNVLSYQIHAAEESLPSPSIVDRAKDVAHGVKGKLKGGDPLNPRV
jgi:hypothetical protein